jgi:leader peptidase (prepilin peptidase) / N-methyltransferase
VLATLDLALVAVPFVLGLVVGSFLNVVVYRVPRGESIVRPPSRCPGCGRAIRALENVPLFSYAWLRGRCAGCGARISPRYPALELATGAVFAWLAAVHGATALLPLWWVLAAGLLAAAAIDFEHHWIPDGISLGGLGFGLAAVPLARTLEGTPYPEALMGSLAGVLLGGGMLWIVGFAHARLSAALGRRFEHWPGEGEELPRPGSLDYWTWFPGLGFGDVKLMAMIGAFLGPAGVIETVLLAAVLGLLLGVAWAVSGRGLASPFGFAPAIAAGALLVLASPSPLLSLILGSAPG